METSYTSFGCPHCNALFGDWFVREAVIEAHLYDQEVAGFDIDRPVLGMAGKQGHWCLPADGISYCDKSGVPGRFAPVPRSPWVPVAVDGATRLLG